MGNDREPAKQKDKGGIVAGLSLISTNLSFIHRDDTMAIAVERMASRKISSLLVYDNEERVVGIVTERDVVRKFVPGLFANKDLATKTTVATVMTMPLVCASAGNFARDIPRLHGELGIRHFPIVRGLYVTRGAPLVPDVVGMVSTTDLARHYLKRLARKGPDPVTESVDYASLVDTSETRPLLVLSKDSEMAKFYQAVFSQMNFDVSTEPAILPGMVGQLKDSSCVLLEFDSFTPDEQKQILRGLPAWPGQLIVATAREELFATFRKHLHGSHQHVALKPLNLPQCAWLFGRD